jgi:hypothetical protein
MDRRERFDSPEETLRITGDALRASMWTALPGIIVSFNAGAMTVVVQPAVMRANLRERMTQALPVLSDVPVVFPGGGGCTLTFPIKAGDECLVIFASRAIDSWWQSGGVQAPNFARTHNLSDGFALVGVRSRPNAFAVATDRAELRANGGNTRIGLDPTSGEVFITAPGGITVVGNVTVTGDVIANGVSLETHTHGGVEPGAGNTGAPN